MKCSRLERIWPRFAVRELACTATDERGVLLIRELTQPPCCRLEVRSDARAKHYDLAGDRRLYELVLAHLLTLRQFPHHCAEPVVMQSQGKGAGVCHVLDDTDESK